MIFPLPVFLENFYFFNPAPEPFCGAGARVPSPMLIYRFSLYLLLCFVGRLALPVLLHPLGLYSTRRLAPNPLPLPLAPAILTSIGVQCYRQIGRAHV